MLSKNADAKLVSIETPLHHSGQSQTDSPYSFSTSTIGVTFRVAVVASKRHGLRPHAEAGMVFKSIACQKSHWAVKCYLWGYILTSNGDKR